MKELTEQEFTTICETSDRLHWQMLCDLLEQNGMGFRVLGGFTSGAQIGLGEHIVTHRIQVAEEDVEQANKLIREYLENLPDEAELEKLATTKDPKYPTIAPIANVSTLRITRIGLLGSALLATLIAILIYLSLLFAGIATLSQQRWDILLLHLFKFSAIGFTIGFLSALIYNVVSSHLGGVQVEIFEISRLLSTSYTEHQCFYREPDGKIIGPLDLEQICQRITEGKILFDTLVQIGGHIDLAGYCAQLETSFYQYHRKTTQRDK